MIQLSYEIWHAPGVIARDYMNDASERADSEYFSAYLTHALRQSNTPHATYGMKLKKNIICTQHWIKI